MSSQGCQWGPYLILIFTVTFDFTDAFNMGINKINPSVNYFLWPNHNF